MRTKTKRSIHMSVCLTPGMHTALVAEATARDMTVSDIIRLAVHDHLADACTCADDDAAGAPGARTCSACEQSGGLPLPFADKED